VTPDQAILVPRIEANGLVASREHEHQGASLDPDGLRLQVTRGHDRPGDAQPRRLLPPAARPPRRSVSTHGTSRSLIAAEGFAAAGLLTAAGSTGFISTRTDCSTHPVRLYPHPIFPAAAAAAAGKIGCGYNRTGCVEQSVLVEMKPVEPAAVSKPAAAKPSAAIRLLLVPWVLTLRRGGLAAGGNSRRG